MRMTMLMFVWIWDHGNVYSFGFIGRMADLLRNCQWDKGTSRIFFVNLDSTSIGMDSTLNLKT